MLVHGLCCCQGLLLQPSLPKYTLPSLDSIFIGTLGSGP